MKFKTNNKAPSAESVMLMLGLFLILTAPIVSKAVIKIGILPFVFYNKQEIQMLTEATTMSVYIGSSIMIVVCITYILSKKYKQHKQKKLEEQKVE